MPDGDELGFLTRIPAAASAAEAAVAIGRAAQQQGTPFWFIGGVVPPGHPILPSFRHHNWPAGWRDRYESEGFAAANPVPQVMALNARPVTVDEIITGRAGFAPHADTLRLLAATGPERRAGLIVPIHGPAGPRGVAMFHGAEPGPDLRQRGVLALLGHVAFARLAELAEFRPEVQATLTQREAALLRAVGRGLDDAGIAAESGITIRTVRFHLANARRKLGARSRAEAVAMALRSGLLGS